MVVAKPAASREANLLDAILALKKEGDDRRFKEKLKKQAEVDNEDDNDDEDNGDVEAHLMKQTEDEIKNFLQDGYDKNRAEAQWYIASYVPF